MEVGDERERAAALVRRRREDDRAGLCDRDGAAGEDAVERVELVRRREPVVLDELDSGGRQAPAARRDHEPPGAVPRAQTPTDLARDLLAGGDAPHLGAVVADPLAEELDALARVERRRAAR